MKVINLGENNTVLNTYLAEMRDSNIQKDSLRFRTNLERVGAIFAYEISKTLAYSVKDVVTPLGTAQVSTPDTKLVISTIMRAGLPLHKGIFDKQPKTARTTNVKITFIVVLKILSLFSEKSESNLLVASVIFVL